MYARVAAEIIETRKAGGPMPGLLFSVAEQFWLLAYDEEVTIIL
jgi:hypothetical protein